MAPVRRDECFLVLPIDSVRQRRVWRRAVAEGPGPRGGMPVMAYDAGHAVTLLFGGVGPEGLVSDLWAWDGRAWRRLWIAARAQGTSP
jgi:hypothetical protein